MMADIAVAALAALGAYAATVATRYSVTSHGDNPWTFEALLNAITHAKRFDAAVKLINGHVNVAYRSPSVNAAVGGVADSYHMRGLAVDIAPGPGITPEAGARMLYQAAARGELGAVRTVIWEPTWCHIEWHDPAEVGPPSPLRFFRKLPTGKYEPVTT